MAAQHLARKIVVHMIGRASIGTPVARDVSGEAAAEYCADELWAAAPGADTAHCEARPRLAVRQMMG